MAEVTPFMSFAGNQGIVSVGGRRRTRRSRGLKTKTLRRMCKQKGLKTTGKKATLMKRLHMRGGANDENGGDGAANDVAAPAAAA